MNIFYKINHWVLVLAFTGLACTALAADFFFSKEAIMASFAISTPQLGIDIAPGDQLFMARIARRMAWDYHLYVGIVFGISILLISYKYKRFNQYKTLTSVSIIGLITTGLVLVVSGILMFLRLYDPITEETFQLLKIIHNYSKWIFVFFVIAHIVSVVREHNTKSEKKLSNMFKK